jgi:hypothetical protein
MAGGPACHCMSFGTTMIVFTADCAIFFSCAAPLPANEKKITIITNIILFMLSSYSLLNSHIPLIFLLHATILPTAAPITPHKTT